MFAISFAPRQALTRSLRGLIAALGNTMATARRQPPTAPAEPRWQGQWRTIKYL